MLVWHFWHANCIIYDMNNIQAGAPELLEEIMTIHREVGSIGNAPEMIPRILRRVGKIVSVDRAYVFQIHAGSGNRILASQRFEWSVDGVESQIGNASLQNIPLREAGYARWLDRFIAYRPVYGTVETFPEPERRLLQDQDICSLVVLPIYTDTMLWGFVGFDDCTTGRVWSAAEVDILLSLAISLGAVLPPQSRSLIDKAPFRRRSTNARISGYATLAGSLLWLDDDEGLLGPKSAFSERRLEARIRSLVRTHRFLQPRAGSETVVLEDYLLSLQDHFDLITQERQVKTTVAVVGAAATTVDAEIIFALGMLISERLCSARWDTDRPVDHMTISAECTGARACVRVQGYDGAGRPVKLQCGASVSGRLFERRLLGHIGDGYRPTPDEECVVARVLVRHDGGA